MVLGDFSGDSLEWKLTVNLCRVLKARQRSLEFIVKELALHGYVSAGHVQQTGDKAIHGEPAILIQEGSGSEAACLERASLTPEDRGLLMGSWFLSR